MQGTDEAPLIHRALMALGVSATALVGALFQPALPGNLRVYAALALIAVAVGVGVASLALATRWPAGTCLWRDRAWWIGSGFLLGAIAFDVYATLHHSPDLLLESNMVARTLLDAGYSITQVKWLGGTGQCSLAITMWMSWSNFRAQRNAYLDWLRHTDGMAPFGVRILGLRRATLGALLLGRGAQPEIAIASSGAAMMAIAAIRWYLGMEWFGWVPVSRLWMPLACMLGAWAVLYAWARRRV